jgi:hypothetical protein
MEDRCKLGNGHLGLRSPVALAEWMGDGETISSALAHHRRLALAEWTPQALAGLNWCNVIGPKLSRNEASSDP